MELLSTRQVMRLFRQHTISALRYPNLDESYLVLDWKEAFFLSLASPWQHSRIPRHVGGLVCLVQILTRAKGNSSLC